MLKKARGISESSLNTFIANLYAHEAYKASGVVVSGVLLPALILKKRYLLQKEKQNKTNLDE